MPFSPTSPIILPNADSDVPTPFAHLTSGYLLQLTPLNNLAILTTVFAIPYIVSKPTPKATAPTPVRTRAPISKAENAKGYRANPTPLDQPIDG